MKRILIITLLLMLFMPFALAAPQPQLELTGKQMIPLYGAPWIGDNSIMYFGNDKDAYMEYSTSTGYLTLSGVAATSLTTGGIVGANNHLTCAAGSTNVDFHLGTGTTDTTTGTNTLNGNVVIAGSKTLTTGTGEVDLNGNVVIAGSKTLTTGTGAVSLLGSPTVATGKTLAVADADKLTVGGVIVPQAITIPIRISSSTVNGTVFIPISGNYQVVGIQEAHSVAATTATATVTATIVKVTGTQAPATAGVVVISNTFNLKGTPETIQTGVLSVASGAIKVNTTERLGIRFNNALTSLDGGCISISLQRIA
jgi:hypothetical protein